MTNSTAPGDKLTSVRAFDLIAGGTGFRADAIDTAPLGEPADYAEVFGTLSVRALTTAIPERIAIARADTVDNVVVAIMAFDLISTVLLQRIYLGVSVTLATHFLALGFLVYRNKLAFSATRLVLYIAFLSVALLSTLLSENTYSPTSYLLAVVCYIPFLFFVPSNKPTYFAVLLVYQQISLVVCFLVFLQIAVQLAGMPMLNMDMFVPGGLVAPTMNYLQPTEWKAGLTKPNAFFMLEASYTSQFLAIGLIIEFVFFRRWLRIVTHTLAILATFSGTGLLLILLALPILARRMWRQLLIVGIVVLPFLGIVAVSSGWFDIASRRATTFDTKGSSANSRFVAPYKDVIDLIRGGDAHKIFYGLGAGKLNSVIAEPDLEDVEYSAIPAVFLSYGLLTTLLFMVFTIYCLFGSAVEFMVMWLAAIEYYLMGGHFVLPPILNYCFVLTSGWYLGPRARQRPAHAR